MLLFLRAIPGFACALAVSFILDPHRGPLRYEEQPLPIGRLLGRNWFKCYRYFSVEKARFALARREALTFLEFDTMLLPS
jgi:hypothetical protein